MSWDCGPDPALGVFPRPPLRIKVSFEYAPPEASGERQCWLALEPSRCRVVADLVCLIRQRFGLGRRVGLSLFLQGCLLPPAESVGLVRDGDMVHVRQTDLLDSFSSDNEAQSLPSSKKRKHRHNEADINATESAHRNGKKRKNKRRKQETEESHKDQEDPQENTRNSLSPSEQRRRKKAEEVNDGALNDEKALCTSKGKTKLVKIKKIHQKPTSCNNEEDEDGSGSASENLPKKVLQKNQVSWKSKPRMQLIGQKETSKISNSQKNAAVLLSAEGKRTSLKTAVSKNSNVAVAVSKETSESCSSSSSDNDDDKDDDIQSDNFACGSKTVQNKTIGAGHARDGKGKRQVTENKTHTTMQVPIQQEVGKPAEESDSSSESDKSDKNKQNYYQNSTGHSYSGIASTLTPAAFVKSSIAEKSSVVDSSSESDSSSNDDKLTVKESEPLVGMAPVNALGRINGGQSAQDKSLRSEVEDDAGGPKFRLKRGQRTWNGAGNRGIGRGQGTLRRTPYPNQQGDETPGTAKDKPPFLGRARGWRGGSQGRGAAEGSATEIRSHLRFDNFTPEPEVLPSQQQSREDGAGAGDTSTNASTVVQFVCTIQNPAVAIRRDYPALPILDGPPRVGDHIAFKMLELNENYSPQVSDYKEGEVLRYDPISRDVEIKGKLNPSAGKRTGGKFELELESEAEAEDNVLLEESVCCVSEETTMTLQWTSLIEPRLIVEVVPPAAVTL